MTNINFKSYVALRGYKPVKVWENENGYYAMIKGSTNSVKGFTQILQGGTVLRLSKKDVDNKDVIGVGIRVVFESTSKLSDILDEIFDDEEEIEEVTATGNVDGYNTPHAFTNNPKKKNKRMADIVGYTQVNENKQSQFKDVNIGDTFLRFGENGQLWKKINRSQAEFIKNVGKQTAPYDKKYGTLNTYPQTMDVTLVNTNEVNEGTNRYHQLRKDESTPNQKIGKGIREMRKQLSEMDTFLSWYGKLKVENDLDSQQYWKRTQKHLGVIREKLNKISEKIRDLSI
jgi:hypothetical protein